MPRVWPTHTAPEAAALFCRTCSADLRSSALRHIRMAQRFRLCSGSWPTAPALAAKCHRSGGPARETVPWRLVAYGLPPVCRHAWPCSRPVRDDDDAPSDAPPGLAGCDQAGAVATEPNDARQEASHRKVAVVAGCPQHGAVSDRVARGAVAADEHRVPGRVDD